jgi:hypothetical protein
VASTQAIVSDISSYIDLLLLDRESLAGSSCFIIRAASEFKMARFH